MNKWLRLITELDGGLLHCNHVLVVLSTFIERSDKLIARYFMIETDKGTPLLDFFAGSCPNTTCALSIF